MKRICTICVRSNSKGVANKNIRQIGDKPLLAYSILQAKMSNLFQTIVVSSDSEEILNIANNWGVDYLIKRPSSLSTDKAPKVSVIQHALLTVEKIAKHQYDTIVDLDVTSPLRYISDISNVVNRLETTKVSNVITGNPSRRSPYFNLVELNDKGFVRLSKPLSSQIFCRQDSPSCYDLNASIYAWNRLALLNNSNIFNEDTQLYIMPEERSIDIDTELDFQIVEFLMNKRGHKIE